MTREQKPRKARRRRASARIGGTTQSQFASRSMSDVLAGRQPAPTTEKAKPGRPGDGEPGDPKPGH